MRTADFNYELPAELIAQEPLPERAQARMMVVHCDTGECEHRRVTDLPDLLRAGDVLAVNDTRVIPARLFGRRPETGGAVELLLVEERGPDEWESLVRMSGRPRVGLEFAFADGRLAARVVAVVTGGRVRLRLAGSPSVRQLIEEFGVAPLPPYIRRDGAGRERAAADRERYQTVYARAPGAVAAPTAGLHFTPELLAALAAGGVRRAAVTLHVGPGTFQPVRTERVEDHAMEAERYAVGEEAARLVNAARAAGGRAVAVGSTTVRALETAAAERGALAPGAGRTALFIHPPFRFRVVDAMLTNFHLPMSSLLMMVCALADDLGGAKDGGAGRELILSAYREAVRREYRFYSFGDCMLVLSARKEANRPRPQ